MEANRPLTTVRKDGWGAQRERLTQTFPRQRKRLFAFSWPAHFSLCLSLSSHHSGILYINLYTVFSMNIST